MERKLQYVKWSIRQKQFEVWLSLFQVFVLNFTPISLKSNLSRRPHLFLNHKLKYFYLK